MTAVTVNPGRSAPTGNPQDLLGSLGEGSVVTLANFDILNSAYVGYSASISSTSGNTTEIPPLGSAVIDVSRRTWIVCAPGKTADIRIMPGAVQWTPSPAQTAAQINALGLAKDSSVQQVKTSTDTVGTNTTGVAKDTSVIATTGAVNAISGQFVGNDLYDVGSTNLPDLTGPGADQPVNLIPLNPVSLTGVGLTGTPIDFYSGYEILAQCLAGAGAIAGCCRVTVTFYNKVTDTTPIATVKWIIPSNNPAVNTVGNGPMRGNFMAVQIASLEPSTVVNATTLNKFSLTGSLRQTQNDNWQADGVTSGSNSSSAKAFTNQLLVASPSVPNGGSINRGILLYGGRARLFAENPGGTGTLVGSIQENTGALGLIWHGSIPQNGTGANPTLVDLILPREPLTFACQNTGAAAGVCNVFITADRV